MESTVLTSVVIAALVSALVSVLTTERGIAAVHVTQERMKWRDKIRELALEVPKALGPQGAESIRQELRDRFSLLVNPHETMDQQILQIITALGAGAADEQLQRDAVCVQHDWDGVNH